MKILKGVNGPTARRQLTFRTLTDGQQMSRPDGRVLWATQHSGQIPIPAPSYVQRLEQDLDAAKMKIQDCEATIIHQAHVIRRLQTQYDVVCPICNQEVPHICAPPSRMSTTAGRQDESFGTDRTSLLGGADPTWTPEDMSTTATDFQSSPRIIPSSRPAPIISTANGALPCSDKPNWSVEFGSVGSRTLNVNLSRSMKIEQGIFRMKFSPDGRLLALVTRRSQVVTIYNVATGAKICLLEDLYERERDSHTTALSFSPDGKYLAASTGSPMNLIRVWEFGRKRNRNILKGHVRSIYALDFSPHGRFIISGSQDGTIRTWNMRDGSSQVLDNSCSGSWAIRFSPDGRHIAAGMSNGEVLIWELRSRQLVRSWKAHTHVVESVAFMPNGERLFSGSWDETSKCWDMGWPTDLSKHRTAEGTSLKERLIFVGHTDRIFSISISPDGKWFASGSKDRSVRIWNTSTGEQECILKGHDVRVFSIDFSLAGGYLASASEDGQVRIWRYEHVSKAKSAFNDYFLFSNS